MVNEQRLVWARLGDTCDDYMCSIVNKQISKKYLAVQMGKVSPTKVVDSTNIALDCITTFLKYFTTDEIKKAVKKLRDIGYNLPTIDLMRISPDIDDNIFNISLMSKKQQYVWGLPNNHEYVAIKNFSGTSHKNTKGYSNKYYEQYRNKSQN